VDGATSPSRALETLAPSSERKPSASPISSAQSTNPSEEFLKESADRIEIDPSPPLTENKVNFLNIPEPPSFNLRARAELPLRQNNPAASLEQNLAKLTSEHTTQDTGAYETLHQEISTPFEEIVSALEANDSVEPEVSLPASEEIISEIAPSPEPPAAPEIPVKIPSARSAPYHPSASDFGLALGGHAAPSPEAFSPSPALAPEMDSLFAETLRELFESGSNNDVELSAEHFLTNGHHEQIAVLFEMTKEALIDPESELRYTKEIESSADRHVESAEVLEQLKNVVQVMNTPMVTLKGRQGLGLSGKSIEPERSEAWALKPVALPRRLAAFVVDVALVGFLSLGTTAAMLLLTSPNFELLLLGERPLNAFDLIDVSTHALCCLIVLGVGLETLSLALWSTTPGLSAMGLLALSRKGREVGKAQALVRSLLMPLSVVSLGWLPAVFGKSTLHDAAARTVVAYGADSRAAT